MNVALVKAHGHVFPGDEMSRVGSKPVSLFTADETRHQANIVYSLAPGFD
jgi:hypothetical protein